MSSCHRGACKRLSACLDTYRQRAYHELVCFEWDPKKADANLRKHGVNFADAALALEDEHAMTIGDVASASEERFMTLGVDLSAGSLLSCTPGAPRRSA